MKIKKYFNGLCLVFTLTILAIYIQNLSFVKALNFGSIVIAILMGMIIKNTVGVKDSMNKGIKFCSKKVLQLAIIFLGFELSFIEVKNLGFKSFILILIATAATLVFTRYLGKKLNISRSLSIFIGAGTSICGASAIAAVNSVIKSENEEDVPFAVGVVTIFGTIFMILYPVIFHFLHLNSHLYSLWAGSSIHGVSQVVAAGFAASSQAGISATLVKLTRVLLVVPITILLSIREVKRKSSEKFSFKNITVPWFILLFLGVIIINSLSIIPENVAKNFLAFDHYLMTAAMVGLGLETSLSSITKVGLKPIYLGAAASIFISVLSATAIILITTL